MKKQLLPLLLILLLFTLISGNLGKKQISDEQLSSADIVFLTEKSQYSLGQEVVTVIKNNLDTEIRVAIRCESVPIDVFQIVNEESLIKTPEGIIETLDQSFVKCPQKALLIGPKKEGRISLGEWKYRIFDNIGQYRLKTLVKKNEIVETLSSNVFNIGEPSFLSKLWIGTLYQPIYNTLIFFIELFPGHSLAFGIILLTILIRLILYFPSAKALRSQKKLQELQPKIQEIQNKYKGNQEKIAMETMRLWKEYKINPFGSCLPLLIQMPVLIALFYVIKDGLNPDNIHLLYGPLKDSDISSINVNFLGILNLSKNNLFVLPAIIGGLQFIQMKMAIAKSKKNQKENTQSGPKEMEMVNNVMTYFMPVMIAFFTASLPAGVGLYWGISTLFSIVQQLIINREKGKNEPKVTVVS